MPFGWESTGDRLRWHPPRNHRRVFNAFRLGVHWGPNLRLANPSRTRRSSMPFGWESTGDGRGFRALKMRRQGLIAVGRGKSTAFLTLVADGSRALECVTRLIMRGLRSRSGVAGFKGRKSPDLRGGPAGAEFGGRGGAGAWRLQAAATVEKNSGGETPNTVNLAITGGAW